MSNPWEEALRIDSPSAYHQYVRKYPKSEHVLEAGERIEFHKVRRRPSIAAYEAFCDRYPESALTPLLRQSVEGLAFEAARAAGSREAYAKFGEEFPGSAHASRAHGNAIYLEAGGFHGRAAELETFASAHPASDFAAEAVRSVETLAKRRQTGFRRVGLVIAISPATSEPDRIQKAFRDRAMKLYEHSPLELVVIPELASEATRTLPQARLEIRHKEELEETTVSGGGDVSRAGYVARTEVTLRATPDGEPIWTREFVLRVLPHERIAGASLLFASKPAKRYWEEFFVPVASWQSNAAVRSPVALEKKVTAVDAVLGRAVVLLEDGDFQILGLSDPEAPVVLAHYDRPSKLEHFEGVRIIGDRVVLFGQDGLEQVAFGPQGAVAATTYSRGEVGSIAALVPIREGLLLASSRGLLLADADGGNAQRVMRRMILGLDALGDLLVFTDGEAIFVSKLELLRQNRVIAQLELGREFKPGRVRVADGVAIVMGEGGVVVLDLADPAKPKMTAKLMRSAIGKVHDAVRIGGRTFLLGERGVQLLDARGQRVVETVDVVPRERIARTGRHLVLVGDGQVQVVDALPFAGRALPARRLPASPTH